MSYNPGHEGNEVCPNCGELGMMSFAQDSRANARSCGNCKHIQTKHDAESFRDDFEAFMTNNEPLTIGERLDILRVYRGL